VSNLPCEKHGAPYPQQIAGVCPLILSHPYRRSFYERCPRCGFFVIPSSYDFTADAKGFHLSNLPCEKHAQSYGTDMCTRCVEELIEAVERMPPGALPAKIVEMVARLRDPDKTPTP
jgi:hypothetical protein